MFYRCVLHCSCQPSAEPLRNQRSLVGANPEVNGVVLFFNIGSFRDLSSLQKLYLNINQLQTVSLCMFDPTHLPSNLDLRIQNNPLDCSYSLCWLKQVDGGWVTVSLSGAVKPECSTPAVLSGARWDVLIQQDLNCNGKCTQN